MLVRPGFEPATSRPADWRSPNWANQAAVKMQVSVKMVNWFKLFGVFLSQRSTGKENPVFSSNYLGVLRNRRLEAYLKYHLSVADEWCLWMANPFLSPSIQPFPTPLRTNRMDHCTIKFACLLWISVALDRLMYWKLVRLHWLKKVRDLSNRLFSCSGKNMAWGRFRISWPISMSLQQV